MTKNIDLNHSNVQCWGQEVLQSNNARRIRESKILSKSELAKVAVVSPLTVDRIERGEGCRLESKRKILLALGLKISQKQRVFRQ